MTEVQTSEQGSVAKLNGGGEVAQYAREQTEAQGRMILAKKYPRNEFEAIRKITVDLQRPELAEDSTYSFSRGEGKVSGPSVILARCLARHWGNLHFGQRIVSVDSEHIHIRSFCVDLETNTTVEAEDKFPKKVLRKSGGAKATWRDTDDERDLRELQNRRAAISVRNCILQVIPADIVSKALTIAKDTHKKHLAKELKENPKDVLARLVIKFSSFGVTTEMLEKYLGKSLEAAAVDEIQDLVGVFKSIQDGNDEPGKYFDVGRDKKQTPDTDELNRKLEGMKGKNVGGYRTA